MRLALACLAIASGHAFRAPTSTLRPTRSWAAPKRPTTALAVAADAGASDRQLGVRVGGALALCGLDELCRVAFRGTGLPHSLAGGAALVAALVAARGAGERAHAEVLAPGAALVLAWMPVFFAPSLVALPLAAPVVSSAADAARLAAVVVGGLALSLASTAWIAGRFDGAPPAPQAAVAAGRPGVAFGTPLRAPLWVLAAAGGAGAVATELRAPLPLRACFVGATLASFVSGTRLTKALAASDKKALKVAAKALHPVAVCALATSAVARLVARLAGADAAGALKAYVALCGAPLQRLLGPSVLALAVGVYGRRRDVAANWKAVAATTAAGVGVGLYGTALLARAAGLPPAARLALLPRCITSPLAIAVCTSLGEDHAAAVALVVVTGVLGAAGGPPALTALGATKPLPRGLAMGAAAHGIGTAQMGSEPEAQPFAAIAMSLVGAASVVAASLPPTRAALRAVAGV